VSESLLQQIARGDADAVAPLLDRYAPLVWALARRSGLPRSEVDDAVQEVFAELWRTAGRFDPGVAGEATFVAMIARRRLIDRRRRLAARGEVVTGEPPEPAEAVRMPRAAEAEEAGRAAAALATLGEEQQRVLRLSVYEGLSHEGIARATGLPLGTVKTHARRGLMRLRELLGVGGEA
jgi:RNA polymerase sigma-70 factor (ECF subfamily)